MTWLAMLCGIRGRPKASASRRIGREKTGRISGRNQRLSTTVIDGRDDDVGEDDAEHSFVQRDDEHQAGDERCRPIGRRPAR